MTFSGTIDTGDGHKVEGHNIECVPPRHDVDFLALKAGIDVVALAPSAVKQAVAGSGRASKAQVQAAVRVLLALRGNLDAHAADALALAYTGMARATSTRVRSGSIGTIEGLSALGPLESSC